MKSSKTAASCLALMLAVSAVPPLWAVTKSVAAAAPTGQAVVSMPVAKLPEYRPIGDSSNSFYDFRNPDQTLRWTVREPHPADEGLLTGGKIRDFLNDRPYSRRPVDLMEQGWTIPSVIAFVDCYGLFDLQALTAQKAISLAQQPVAELGLDGVSNLEDAAHYYSKTGRAELSDAIYNGLSAHLWPNYAPKDLSATVLYQYALYLQERGNNSKTKTIHDAFVAINPDSSCPGYHRDGDQWLPSTTDWQPAAKAYAAIQSQSYDAAAVLIGKLLEEERKKATHEQGSISRLIQLARAYTNQGKKAEAQALLEQVAAFTDAQMMLNTRMYIFGELYLLQDEDSRAAHESWVRLDETVQTIDRQWPGGNYQYSHVSKIREERIVQLLDNLALAYDCNNEPAKALAILKNALAYYPAMSFGADDMWAQLALFEAEVGNFSAVKEYLAKALYMSQGFYSFNLDVVARIIEVCSNAGKLDQAGAVSQQMIAAYTKRSANLSAQAEPGNMGRTPEEIIEIRAYNLRAKLSPIRLRYGEVLNKERRFAEAEQTLKLVLDNGSFLVDQQSLVFAVALGQSLEGQKKYSEALTVYAKYATFPRDPLLLLQQLVCLVGSKPDFGPADQGKVIDITGRVGQFYMCKYMAKPMETLLEAARAQKWTDENIQRLHSFVDYIYVVEGKVNVKEQQKKAEAESQQQLDSIIADVNAGQLDRLQKRASADQESHYSGLAELMKAGQFETAEKLIKLFIERMKAAPDSFDREALYEKYLLADYYMDRKRFAQAKALGDDILTTLMNDPAAFVRACGRSENSYRTGVSDVQVAIIGHLHSLEDRLISAGRAADGEALALRTLECEKKWLGRKNFYLFEAYRVLSDAAKALKNTDKQTRYQAQVQSILDWYSGPKETRGQRDTYPPDLFPKSFWLNLAAKPIYNEEALARINYLFQSSLERHGEGSSQFYSALSGLISFYWHTQKYDQAQKLLLRKMGIIENIEGQCGNYRSLCLAERACLEISRNNIQGAKDLLVLARKDDSRLGKTEGPELLAAYAAVEYKLGQKEAAIAMARKAVERTTTIGRQFNSSPLYLPAAQILADTDLAKRAEDLLPHGRCMPEPTPDPGLFAIK